MDSASNPARRGQGRAKLFVGDAHLRPREPERTERFARFLERMTDRVDEIFILGDLFDFWIGHKPRLTEPFAAVFERFAKMHARGVRFHYIGGNHDFFVGPPFVEGLDAQVDDREIPFEVDGHRGLAVHGDLLNPRDYGYRLLRWLLRTRLVYWLTLLTPSALLERIAEGMSRTSRKFTASLPPPPIEWFRDFAENARARGFDCSVMGHFHTPGHHRFACPDGPHDLYVVGDWFTQDQYVVYEDGAFHVERFEG